MNSFTKFDEILSCFGEVTKHKNRVHFYKYKYRKYEFVLSAHVRRKQMHSTTWKKR